MPMKLDLHDTGADMRFKTHLFIAQFLLRAPSNVGTEPLNYA
jgi:hypothetical protein